MRRIEDVGRGVGAGIIAEGNLKVADHSRQPQPLLASAGGAGAAS
jgi:hypothetical protein